MRITGNTGDAERIAEGIGEDMEQQDKAERKRLRFQEPPPPEAPKNLVY